MGMPPMGCKTLGRDENMRLPLPAAKIMIFNFMSGMLILLRFEYKEKL
jgi:hypothetical protein